jgi:hypothetical protein
MLIDRYMPRYDVRSYHCSVVQASPERAYAAFRALDFRQSRVIRWLFAVRTIPYRLSRKRAVEPRQAKSFLESILSQGWVLLEEAADRELVAGTVTLPWEPVVKFRAVPAEAFAGFDTPGFAKIAWNIAVERRDSGCLVSTETRVLTTDPRSRRRFRMYWLALSPFIKLIRRIVLRMLRRELERGARSSTI